MSLTYDIVVCHQNDSICKKKHGMKFEDDVKNILNEIGLTEIQSNVYLYILKSGGSNVSKIASSLKINRTNSYIILEKLKSLNLVIEENKYTGKVFYAKSYKSILSNLKTKSDLITKYEKKLNNLAPIFNTFTISPNNKQLKIRTYDGLNGLDEVIYDILDSNTNSSEILLYTNQENEKEIFSKLKHNDFIKRRIERKIKIRVLAADNQAGSALKSKDKENLRHTKILPPDFHFDSEIYIYDEKICMIDFNQNIIGVIIESPELYKIHSQIFELMWRGIK
ncbi:MAG: helix-turn-helix domain-containing protein [bacterium]